MRRLAEWAPLFLGIVLLSTLIALQWPRIIRGQNDFVALYAGGKLAGTPGLYSRAANQAVIQSVIRATMESVTYTRPPFYAILLKPLASFPYIVAYWIFSTFCVGSVLWFVLRFSKECPALPFYACFSIPLAAFLPQGQDAPLLLTFTGISVLLTRRKQDFLAGLVLSLCAIKFNLFLLVPCLLIAKKRWRILAGGITGTAVLLLLGIAITGAKRLQEYIAVLRDPWINFSTDMMPNLHGLTASLVKGAAVPLVETGMVCAVIVAFLWICKKTKDYEFSFAISLLCGLLVSYHSGISDEILLLLVFVLVVNCRPEKPLRIALAIALSPIPYFTGLSISVAIPISLLLVLALAVVVVARQESNQISSCQEAVALQ